MEKFIMADGCATRVRDNRGEEPAIVLLHGYLESIEVWDEFIPLLSPPFRVVAPDLPGHGISEVKGKVHSMEFEADVVHSVLTGLGVKRCCVVGHSMGGYVALEFLRKYPEMLSGIILLHSTPNPDSEAKREQRQREIELVEAGRKDLLARMTPDKGFAAENRSRMAGRIGELADQILLTEDEGITALLRGMCGRADANGTLRDSPVPQLFILGRGDEYITAPVAEKMIAGHPQARVAWMEHSGHMSFLEEPEKCAEIIRTFVRETGGTRTDSAFGQK